MNIINKGRLNKFFQHTINEGGRVIEVNMKTYYVIPAGDSISNERIKTEWFEKFPLASSHAYRDGCKIGGAEIIEEIKFLTLEEVK